MSVTQIERYRGCLLGLAAGDAVGTTLEFKRPGSFSPLEDMVGGGPFGLEPGQWTDDTSMALCLAQSLIEQRSFDPVDQMKNYLRWYREGHMSSTGKLFDIGNATREALDRFEATGEPYSGSTDLHRAGNGSIMRLAPVPLFYARGPIYSSDAAKPLQVVEKSGESSRTTHGAPAAVDACRYLGALLVGALNGIDKEELLSAEYPLLRRASRASEENRLVPEIEEVASGSFKRRELPQIRGRTYVVASLEAALWAFHNSGSFREGCLLAVNLGEDADTTGAVYGQLAGAFYGERGIPGSWRSKLAHRLLIEYFAERLFRLGKTVDWDEILAFLPIFERSGFVPEGEQTEQGRLPNGNMVSKMSDFNMTLYTTGIIYPFKWSRWHHEAERLFNEPAVLERADEATLRKLLTFLARVDHFNEGHFDEMIDSGHITAILRHIKELREHS